jgi:hypothetical protein
MARSSSVKGRTKWVLIPAIMPQMSHFKLAPCAMGTTPKLTPAAIPKEPYFQLPMRMNGAQKYGWA